MSTHELDWSVKQNVVTKCVISCVSAVLSKRLKEKTDLFNLLETNSHSHWGDQRLIELCLVTGKHPWDGSDREETEVFSNSNQQVVIAMMGP